MSPSKTISRRKSLNFSAHLFLLNCLFPEFLLLNPKPEMADLTRLNQQSKRGQWFKIHWKKSTFKLKKWKIKPLRYRVLGSNESFQKFNVLSITRRVTIVDKILKSKFYLKKKMKQFSGSVVGNPQQPKIWQETNLDSWNVN